MELTQDIIQKFNQLAAKPASVRAEDMPFLNAISEQYPYFQTVHLLLAKAAANSANQNHFFAKAAVYNSGSLLHQLIYQPENLVIADDFNVLGFEPEFKKVNVVESIQIDAEQDLISTEVSEPIHIEEDLNHSESLEQNEAKQESFNEIETVETAFIPEIEIAEQLAGEEEVFEEITEVKIIEPTQDNAEEVLEAESLAASDFFAFENTIADTITEVKEPIVEEYNQQAEDESVVTKYDDDNLPYTFLWWLAKTRKEHEQIFRPYVTQKPQANTNVPAKPGQLQHQYVEHIFHIQTPFSEADILKNTTSLEPVLHKSDEIIEKFIQNDPHIRALKPDQIDNENKAKKSSEDNFDLVSETLAEVYIEQMLYHKAIDTYQKLSLKFPEKSSYFADLIQSLEKKI